MQFFLKVISRHPAYHGKCDLCGINIDDRSVQSEYGHEVQIDGIPAYMPNQGMLTICNECWQSKVLKATKESESVMLTYKMSDIK